MNVYLNLNTRVTSVVSTALLTDFRLAITENADRVRLLPWLELTRLVSTVRDVGVTTDVFILERVDSFRKIGTEAV